jgi:citrate synthase
MANSIKLVYGKKEYELPVVEGSEGEKAVDISQLRAIGIPTNMFTVMFAIGRLPGWVAQWKESMDDPNWKLGRPRQIYTGPTQTKFVPIDER